MCGRYVSSTQAEMERYWELTDVEIRKSAVSALQCLADDDRTGDLPYDRRSVPGSRQMGIGSLLVEGGEATQTRVQRTI